MKTIITAQVIDQTLMVTNAPKLASGGENVFQVELTLDSYWDGYGLEAVFWRKKERQYRVVLVEGVGTIPWELTSEPGEVHFSVRGVQGSIVRSTEAVVLNFVQGSPAAGSYPSPLPDVYKQVLSAYASTEMAVAKEQARIDNLVANGGTSDDAELIDIRVRADGHTFTSAGGATRAVDIDLQKYKSETDTIRTLHQNMYDLLNWSTGGHPDVNYVTVEGETCVMSGAGTSSNFGVSTKLFDAAPGKIYVKTNVACNQSSFLTLYIAGQHGTGSAGAFKSVRSNLVGEQITVLDPDDYNFDIKCVWLVHATGSATEDNYTYTITEFKVFQSAMKDRGYEGSTGGDFLLELANRTEKNRETFYKYLPELNGDTPLVEGVSDLRRAWSQIELDADKVDTAKGVVICTDIGDAGFCTTELAIDPSKHVYVSFDVAHTNTGGNTRINVLVADGYDGDSKFKEIAVMSQGGHVEVSFDPAYHAVYSGIDVKYVYILHHTTGYEACRTEVSNLVIKQNVLLDNGLTTNVPESIVKIMRDNTTEKVEPDYLVAPSGEKYAMQVDASGNLVSVPVIPSKALYLGNSLLLGFQEFGMAASAVQYDYYYLVNQAIIAQNSGYTASRYQASPWEGCTSYAAQNAYLSDTLLPLLTEDTDLVIVQLGDNVNTSEKKAVFAEGVKNLLRFIRTHCPKARVAWVGAWYQDQTKMNQMQDACRATGCTFINIWDLAKDENRSAVGNTYTLSNGAVYTIASEGVASHPGDAGFKAIANRILYALGIADHESYYK